MNYDLSEQEKSQNAKQQLSFNIADKTSIYIDICDREGKRFF